MLRGDEPSLCSPHRVDDGVSCFTLDELVDLAEAWNTTESVDKVDPTLPREQLVSSLRDRMGDVCGNEACWLDQSRLVSALRNRTSTAVYDEITRFALKPKGRKGKHEWLSTPDIENVMRQYERVFPYFRFISCVASDHYQLHPAEFPAETIATTPISAIVFNLDNSRQRGSHWVAVVFAHDDDDVLTIEYFDSTGNKPNRNIREFLSHPFFHDAVYVQNTVAHQRQNSECGVYSMYFILQRCYGVTVDEFNERRVTDKEMNDYRAYLFRAAMAGHI